MATKYINLDNTKLIKLYQSQRSLRRNVEGIWNDIMRLVLPYRGDMFRDYTDELSVDWYENINTYTSVATIAHSTLSASLHGSITSPAVQWFHMKFRKTDVNKMPGAKEWLDDTARKIYEALQDSNFNVEANEMYQDICGFGTSILVEEDRGDVDFYDQEEGAEEWLGLDFQCIPIRECFFEQDSRGGVYRFYRRHSWTSIQILSKFPEDQVPDWIIEKADGEASEERIEVIFCVYARVRRPDLVDTSQALAPNKRPYGWRYVVESDHSILGTEGGYYEMPAFVVRYLKASGSQWGFSPAMQVLPDLKTYNSLVELGLSALEKAVDPATLTTQRGLFGDLDLQSGSITVVNDVNEVIPYESRSNFQAEFAKEQQLKQDIREAFHANDLQLKESPAMTATEVAARMELMQRLLGPTLGRLQSDFLDPLIKRTFKILMRAGQLQEIPEEMYGEELDISYIGTLTQAQSSDQIASIDRWLATGVQLSQVAPEVLDIIDFDEAMRVPGALQNIPGTMMRDQQEVDTKRNERKEAQAKAQQMEMAKQGSEVVRNVGGPEGMAAMEGGAGQQVMDQMTQ